MGNVKPKLGIVTGITSTDDVVCVSQNTVTTYTNSWVMCRCGLEFAASGADVPAMQADFDNHTRTCRSIKVWQRDGGYGIVHN